MKHTSLLLILSAFLTAAGPADAAPWNPFKRRPPPPPPSPPHSDNHGRPDYNRDRDRRVDRLEFKAQIRLKKLGYYRGPVDGDFGRGSRAALAAFQRHNGLRPTGELDGRTIRALRL